MQRGCCSKNATSSLRRSLRLSTALPALVDAMDLEDGLGGVEANHGNASSWTAPFGVCTTRTMAHRCPGAVHPSRNDARGIAQIVRTGWFRAVHVKSPACRSWRALLAARRLVLNKMRDLENGVRALLREAGLTTVARTPFY